ncbi:MULTISPECIES: type II secretion system protein [Acidobacteriaceae]|uniref:type II secretion system protein n=1 Tax=Acidobacteriaceae TaxID=204434 RepID=UPI0020B130C9|nr:MULTISPECIES: type II secretion system protein [Acidobacteriaceae]MDW5264975.1 type II secretion system protein [Edaphobacter sp.]
MPNTDLHRLHRSETIDGRSACAGEREGEQGFLLLGLIVAIFLILLALGVAAPRAAHELRREREVETVRRGNAYVRAIEVYYLKNGNYPTSIEQLEKTNNVRFLRKRYMDPMTGKDDWRVIHLGEAKTTVKTFFGKPLGGIESTSLGGSSAGGAGSTGSAFGSSGSSSGGGLTSSFGSSSSSGSGGLTSSFGSSSSGAGGTGSTGLSSSSTSGTSSGSGSNGIGGQSGIGSAATAGPIVGIGLVKSGNSIRTLNEQTTYETWEFLYDPRIEQLKAKVSLFGGGMASTDAANLGSAADSKSSTSGDLNFGSGSSSGGQSTGGGLGSGSSGSSGFGSGTSSSPSPTTNTPQ